MYVENLMLNYGLPKRGAMVRWEDACGENFVPLRRCRVLQSLGERNFMIAGREEKQRRESRF